MADADRIPPRDYRLILDLVREQTQRGPPFMSQFDVVGKASLAGLDTDVAAAAVDNLVARGRLLAYEGDERTRLTLPDADRLRRWVRNEGDSDDPDQELVAWLNRQLQEVDDDE